MTYKFIFILDLLIKWSLITLGINFSKIIKIGQFYHIKKLCKNTKKSDMDRQTVNCTETSQNGLTETEKLINQHMG